MCCHKQEKGWELWQWLMESVLPWNLVAETFETKDNCPVNTKTKIIIIISIKKFFFNKIETIPLSKLMIIVGIIFNDSSIIKFQVTIY